MPEENEIPVGQVPLISAEQAHSYRIGVAQGESESISSQIIPSLARNRLLPGGTYWAPVMLHGTK